MNDAHITQRLDDEGIRRDLGAYWEVHRRVAESLDEAVRADLGGEPRLRPLLERATRDPEGTRRMREMVGRALEEGDWSAYLEGLAEQGAAYARLGIRFADWFRVVSAYRHHVMGHLVDAYGGDGQRLAAAMRGMAIFHDVALQTLGEGYLATHEATIDKQRRAIVELSTPVLQIRPGMLLMPVVGILDTGRSRQLTEDLLHAVRSRRARAVVMDITGVAQVDSEVANRLVQAAEASRLMGATPILTGVSSAVAQTLVALGVDLKGLRTVGDLQGGIAAGDEILGYRVVSVRPSIDEQP